MFDISFPDPDELMREIKRQAYAEVKNQVKKELESVFCPVHQQFVHATATGNGAEIEFSLEGCCDEVLRKAEGILNQTNYKAGSCKMNRAVRRPILVELFQLSKTLKNKERISSGPGLLPSVPKQLGVDAEELKATCQLMAEEGLIYMDVVPGCPEEYAVKIEAKGREAYKDRNDEIPLWLDIIWVLRADQRREIELSNDGRLLSDPKRVLGEVLRGSEGHLLHHALEDLDRKGFVDIASAVGGTILSARLLTNGKLFLQQQHHHHQGAPVPQQYNDNSIHVNAQGSIVNVQSVLEQTNQRLENSTLNNQDKVKELFAELMKALENVHIVSIQKKRTMLESRPRSSFEMRPKASLSKREFRLARRAS